LRFTGALAGAAVGLAAQVFVVPSLDSITGFTILFLLVTSVAAWIGLRVHACLTLAFQFALAFTSSTSGISALKDPWCLVATASSAYAGLVHDVAVFDQLWSAPTVVQMRKAFISQFRLLAQLIKQPLSDNLTLNVARSHSLRETINGGFNQVRALADAVWFEFGPSRQQDLALRSSNFSRWQSQLRMLFISCVALAKYRLRFPVSNCLNRCASSSASSMNGLARALDGMSDRLEGKAYDGTQNLEAAFVAAEGLCSEFRFCRSQRSPHCLT